MEIVRLVIGLLLTFLEFTIILECICSWIAPMRNSMVYYYITKINNPFLSPIRKLFYKYQTSGMMIDLSPVVLFLIISLIRKIFMV